MAEGYHRCAPVRSATDVADNGQHRAINASKARSVLRLRLACRGLSRLKNLLSWQAAAITPSAPQRIAAIMYQMRHDQTAAYTHTPTYSWIVARCRAGGKQCTLNARPTLTRTTRPGLAWCRSTRRRWPDRHPRPWPSGRLSGRLLSRTVALAALGQGPLTQPPNSHTEPISRTGGVQPCPHSRLGVHGGHRIAALCSDFGG